MNLSKIILAILVLLLTMGKRNPNNLSQDTRNVRRRLVRQQKIEQQKVKAVVVHNIRRCVAINERKRKSREILTRINAIKR